MYEHFASGGSARAAMGSTFDERVFPTVEQTRFFHKIRQLGKVDLGISKEMCVSL